MTAACAGGRCGQCGARSHRMYREVIVYDQFDAFHVNAARGDVGRDQDAVAAGFEALQASRRWFKDLLEWISAAVRPMALI